MECIFIIWHFYVSSCEVRQEMQHICLWMNMHQYLKIFVHFALKISYVRVQKQNATFDWHWCSYSVHFQQNPIDSNGKCWLSLISTKFQSCRCLIPRPMFKSSVSENLLREKCHQTISDWKEFNILRFCIESLHIILSYFEADCGP